MFFFFHYLNFFLLFKASSKVFYERKNKVNKFFKEKK